MQDFCFDHAPSATVSFITTAIDTSHKTIRYNYLNKSRTIAPTPEQETEDPVEQRDVDVHSLFFSTIQQTLYSSIRLQSWFVHLNQADFYNKYLTKIEFSQLWN